jgi:RNA polymerase I-specific transcription initiation factor RRN3
MTDSPKLPRSHSVHTAGRTSSTTGKKRPREEDAAAVASRRTRSAGADGERNPDSRGEAAFQRQLIGVFVPRALKEAAEGKMANYNDLVAHFLPKPLDPNGVALPPLLPLLRALTSNVSLLRPELHGSLVTAIIALPWATADDRFVKTYVGWAGVLVSAHPVWAKEVVAMAVKGFRWREYMCTVTGRLASGRPTQGADARGIS